MLIFYSIRSCVNCDEADDATKQAFEAGKNYADANGLDWKVCPLTTTERLDQYRSHKLSKKTKLPVWVDTETNKVWTGEKKQKAKKSSTNE